MSLALLFPPTCLACRRLLDAPLPAELCAACGRGHAPLPDHRDDTTRRMEALFDYDGPLGTVLAQFKFQGDLALAGPLGRLLSEHPRLCTTRSERPWDVVVPVPLHPARLWARGFNQALLLVRWALWHAQRQQRSAPKLRADYLRRIRYTPPQSELDAQARRANVHDAFAVPDSYREHVKGRRILVVDDVTTTGATMQACFAALEQSEAIEVGGLSLLRALD